MGKQRIHARKLNMKQLQFIVIILAGMFSLKAMAAVQIVQCEDAQGHKTFQMTCPPGTKQVKEMQLATGAPADKGKSGAANITATLYYIPDCDACDGVREYLRDRHIPITEKNVMGNIDLQKEMKKVSGKQSVPVVVIGKKVLIGYNRTDLKQALAAAGYVEKPGAAGAPPASAGGQTPSANANEATD